MPKIAFAGLRQKEGWRGQLPFFRTECPEHGVYEAYPRGRGWLRCPKCSYEVQAPYIEAREPRLNTIRKRLKAFYRQIVKPLVFSPQ